MRMINLAFVAAAAILTAIAHASADPTSTDSQLSALCRAAMDAARDKSAYDALLKNLENQKTAIETWENAYFDRFDADKTITLAGTVKEFQWSNPHAHIKLTVNNNGGQADQQWVIEMNGPAALARLGWRPKTLIPDMMIAMTIHPLRHGVNGGHLVSALLGDGTQMSGGRDRPGILQELREKTAGTEAAAEELRKKYQLSGCGL